MKILYYVYYDLIDYQNIYSSVTSERLYEAIKAFCWRRYQDLRPRTGPIIPRYNNYRVDCTYPAVHLFWYFVKLIVNVLQELDGVVTAP